MAEVGKYHPRVSIIGRIWATALVRRLTGLAGLAMIVTGYWMILTTSELPKSEEMETVARHAINGMVLVFGGGVIEALVLLAWARR